MARAETPRRRPRASSRSSAPFMATVVCVAFKICSSTAGVDGCEKNVLKAKDRGDRLEEVVRLDWSHGYKPFINRRHRFLSQREEVTLQIVTMRGWS